MTEIREAGGRDFDFLASMLADAAGWRLDADKPTVEEVLTLPAFGRYVAGWPRWGDGGVIAEDQEEPIGAAWYRLFNPFEHGYGFVASDIPELTIGVVSKFRRRGVGRALLRALARHARTHGFRALSLSVEPDNYARHLYETEGFEVVGRMGDALTMVAELTPV